ncbi:hypothetical protein C8R43DRAFT_1126491 [Mycena crocata]|nr:hypothetical protein C8R43DRAFT_1126491 [Mycena crocata]
MDLQPVAPLLTHTRPHDTLLQHYNFPPYQYVPPEQFYQGLAPPPAPYGPLQEHAGHALVAQPPSAPPSPPTAPKRGRGRPRGSGNKKATATRPQTTAKVTKAQAAQAAKKVAQTTKKVSRTSDSQGKKNSKMPNDENRDPNGIPTIDISDSDSEIEETGPKRWTDKEKTQFFRFVLAQDETGDYRFEQHKKNPMPVYKRASEILFSGRRSPKSVGSLWARSIEIFGWIIAFESFTGNGGGDPDSDDPSAVLARLDGARRAGIVVGQLKPALIATWEKNGWRDLFNDRLGASAKVSREVVRNSASALSDLDVGFDDGNTSDGHIDPALRREDQSMTNPPKNAAAVVSEPKHTPASRFRTQANNSLGHMGEFMKAKMSSEEKKTKLMEAKLEMDQAKLALEKQRVESDAQRAKVEMARTVLSTEGASSEAKNAANAYLVSLFL